MQWHPLQQASRPSRPQIHHHLSFQSQQTHQAACSISSVSSCRQWPRRRPLKQHQQQACGAAKLQQHEGMVPAPDELYPVLYGFGFGSTGSPDFALVMPYGPPEDMQPHLAFWQEPTASSELPLSVQFDKSTAAAALASYLLTRQLPEDASATDLPATPQHACELGLDSCAAACSDQLSGMPELPMSAVCKLLALPSEQYSSMVSSQLDKQIKDSIQQVLGDLDSFLASKAQAEQLQRLPLPGLEMLLLDERTQMASPATPLIAIIVWSMPHIPFMDDADVRRMVLLKEDVIRADRSYTSGAAGREDSMSSAADSASTSSSSRSNEGDSPHSHPPPAAAPPPAAPRGSRPRGVPPPRMAQAGAPPDKSIQAEVNPSGTGKHPVQRARKEPVFIGMFFIRGKNRDVLLGPRQGIFYRESNKKVYVTEMFQLCSDGIYRFKNKH